MDTLQVNGQEVRLDPKNLEFSEATLTEYLQREGGYYNNFGAMLAYAENELQTVELAHESLRGETFRNYKDEGGSDKYADARTDHDELVVEAKQKVVDARLHVRLLVQHLRAWDKNHENAQSLGHFLRKEMDKLNTDFIRSHNGESQGPNRSPDEIDQFVTHMENS